MFSGYRHKITPLLGLLLLVILMGGGSVVKAVTITLSTQEAQQARGVVQASADVVLTSVGNATGAYPFSGTATSTTATSLATLDGGAGVTIYTLTDTDVGVSDYFEFTLASVNASTAFPTGNLNIRWFDGATETVATLTLAGGDTDGVNLDGATFRLQWQTAPATGDTVRVVYHESISAGDAVTVDRESISFTVP